MFNYVQYEYVITISAKFDYASYSSCYVIYSTFPQIMTCEKKSKNHKINFVFAG